MARCARDLQRLGPADTRVADGFLVHVHGGADVEPLHEVIEGRLLVKDSDGLRLQARDLEVVVSYARAR